VKQILLISLLALLFSACSDTKEEQKQEAVPTKSASASDISISDNANAYEMKVESANDVQDRSYYYSYNQRKQKPHEVRTPYTANMNVRSPYERVRVSLIVKKLSKNFILKCSPCHNDYANGLIGPSLLDKNSDFIYETIMKYKSGEKNNALMVQMVKMMDDEEIKELSIEIENFNTELKKQRSGEK
jgi:cytochrome c553